MGLKSKRRRGGTENPWLLWTIAPTTT